ncbi:hypothetical protein LGM90_27625 [Burkholderia sp. AU28942]|uniref:hypothetical protein n=1 Tax=Burkholderia TaxID=32008 RepID=UPI0008414EBD|nr:MULTISPECIES: hypothetical protein [Burkholderia]AOK03329.1 hypothetical protein WK25_01930 [Burkholderia latens]MCA8312286.1 hypothetical protein [Burkholderia sp. AU28942]
MQTINQLSKQIQDRRANVTRLDAEIERVEKRLGEAGRDRGLAALMERRAAIVKANTVPRYRTIGIRRDPVVAVGFRASAQEREQSVAEIDAEIARIEEQIAGERRDYGLPVLVERRKAVIVDALQNGVKADTTAIDKEIAAAEKRRSADAAAIERDREAVDMLTSARDRARAACAELEAERAEAVSAYLLAEHHEAQARYFEAIAALAGPVEKMVAVERAWCLSIPGKAFPARSSSKVLADVRETGLRVTWEHSALRDPAVAACYTDNFREAWYVPEWADARNESFADESTAALVGDLKSAGVDVTMPVREVKKSEPQVEIEVVRGTIGGGDESVKLDPVSGARVKGKPVSHGPGSRLMMPTSEAALLVNGGFARYTAEVDAERGRLDRQRMEEMANGTGRTTVHRQGHYFI